MLAGQSVDNVVGMTPTLELAFRYNFRLFCENLQLAWNFKALQLILQPRKCERSSKYIGAKKEIQYDILGESNNRAFVFL